jgi:hypothetical protein
MPHTSCNKFGKQKQKKCIYQEKPYSKVDYFKYETQSQRRPTSIFSSAVIFYCTYNLLVQKHKPPLYNSPCPDQVENYDEALDAT